MKSVSFSVTPEVTSALEGAAAALRVLHPGQSISRSDVMRVAVIELAGRLQRVAKSDHVET